MAIFTHEMDSMTTDEVVDDGSTSVTSFTADDGERETAAAAADGGASRAVWLSTLPNVLIQRIPLQNFKLLSLPVTAAVKATQNVQNRLSK